MDRALKMVYYDDANVEKDIFAQLSLAQKHFQGDGMPRDESATRRIPVSYTHLTLPTTPYV